MTERLRLEVEGQLVRGKIEGSGDRERPMVVYLHGFGSTAFGSKGDFFSDRFIAHDLPFCRFDLRGHGESGGDLAAATVERNLLDLAAVVADLRRRGWERFLLVGSSYGALTALVHACRHPFGVVAGVFIAPAVGIADSIRRREGDERLRAWSAAGEAPLDVGGSLSWGFYQDAEKWHPEQIASDLTVPCLLFHGLRDEEIDWSGVHDFAARSNHVQLHCFAAGGHSLVDFLPIIWDETSRFLARHLSTG